MTTINKLNDQIYKYINSEVERRLELYLNNFGHGEFLESVKKLVSENDRLKEELRFKDTLIETIRVSNDNNRECDSCNRVNETNSRLKSELSTAYKERDESRNTLVTVTKLLNEVMIDKQT